jgi:hypothetical protein
MRNIDGWLFKGSCSSNVEFGGAMQGSGRQKTYTTALSTYGYLTTRILTEK